MAKDPAMLWYWSDWFSGTSLISRFLKGCYMDLLHAQFNSGRLSLEEIKICLGSDFGTSWPALQKKFKQENNLFFNERLEVEKLKRQAFSNSRRENVEKRYHKPTYVDTSVEHMNLHMENENENENKNEIERGVQGGNNPTFEKVHEVFLSNGGTKEMAQAFFNSKEAVSWMSRGSPITKFASMVPTFITNWKENEFRKNVNGSPTKQSAEQKWDARVAYANRANKGSPARS